MTMVDLPKEPCAELLLWGLSREDYPMLRIFLLENRLFLANMSRDG